MDWINSLNELEVNGNEIMSFFDYYELFKKHPERELRPTSAYLQDMVNHFGRDEEGHLSVFGKDDQDAPAVFGQHKIQEKIIEQLRNFAEEGFNNKFILLVGPNGSSKSSLVKRLMKGAEDYSKTDEGALYSFSWIFPINTVVKGTLGLNQTQSGVNINSYAELEDKDISAILTSDLKDHPLLLIPKEARKDIIQSAYHDRPEKLEEIEKSYLVRGDLSKRNRMIYDALLKNYKGKHEEVLKHIRVERYTISRRYSRSAVTIEPQLHVDAKMQQITMDQRLASLPPSLQSLNLFQMSGETIHANRGILEYSDLLKRPLDTFKYLLMTMESGSINLGGILTELDIFFIGTSNEVHLTAFKQHPDFNSFKGRFTFIRVPYLLDYRNEMHIYQRQIDSIKDRTRFEPGALEAIGKFSVMTRIRSCMSKHYEKEPKLSSIVTTLNPLEKCYLYSKDRAIPARLDVEQSQLLKHNIGKVESEFEFDNLYEGKFGISPRDIKNMIYRLADMNKDITFIEVLEYFKRIINKKSEYDFLNMSAHGDYHNPQKFIELINEDSLDTFDKQLRGCLGLVDDRSYEDYLQKYIQHINALIKGEKIKNEVTGKYEESDQYFIKEFESNINLKEDATNFRSHLISKLGAWYLDNRGEKVDYVKIFPEVVDRLKESFRKEQEKVIHNISKNLVFFESEVSGKEIKGHIPLKEDIKKEIQQVIENLKSTYGYSQNGSFALIKYLIKERY